jgi:hypothetical protein
MEFDIRIVNYNLGNLDRLLFGPAFMPTGITEDLGQLNVRRSSNGSRSALQNALSVGPSANWPRYPDVLELSMHG